MIKLLLIPILFLLTACSTMQLPVNQSFPLTPATLLKKCPDLNLILDPNTQLPGLLSVVIENYSLYYQCAETVNDWNQWYLENKKIFNNINSGKSNE
jgi:hypothetical protein